MQKRDKRLHARTHIRSYNISYKKTFPICECTFSAFNFFPPASRGTDADRQIQHQGGLTQP